MTQEPTFQPAQLATLVRDAREGLGLSKAEVSRATGLSREWLRLLEAGERPDGAASQPKPENVRALALVLRIPEAQALNLAGHRSDAPIEMTAGRPTCRDTAFAADVNRLPTRVRGLVMDLVAAVALEATTPPAGHRKNEAVA